MIPALRTMFAASSRPTTSFSSPSWKLSICGQGLRRPADLHDRLVADAQQCPDGQAEQVDAAGGDVFAEFAGRHVESLFADFGEELLVNEVDLAQVRLVGSCATRERCLTVTRACTSPSTPSPASNMMLPRLGLVNEYSLLLLTAVPVPLIPRPRSVAMIRHEPSPRPSAHRILGISRGAGRYLEHTPADLKL